MTIIPETRETAINFRARIDKPASFTKRNYFLHYPQFFVHYGCLGFTTISSPWIKAGSLTRRVVKEEPLMFTISPVTVSRPEKTIPVTKLGAVPIRLRDGARDIWKANSL